MNFLASAVSVFHMLVVVFVIVTPFVTDTPLYLLLHFVTVCSLLIHWYTNSDTCSLSILESKLRGEPRTKTFTHQFVTKIYKIPESDWNNLIYIATPLLGAFSFYKLYTSRVIADSKRKYSENVKQDDEFKVKLKKALEFARPVVGLPV